MVVAYIPIFITNTRVKRAQEDSYSLHVLVRSVPRYIMKQSI